jgi:hypothetical protein
MKLSVAAVLLSTACSASAFTAPGGRARLSVGVNALAEPELTTIETSKIAAPAIVLEVEKPAAAAVEIPSAVTEELAVAVDPREKIIPYVTSKCSNCSMPRLAQQIFSHDFVFLLFFQWSLRQRVIFLDSSIPRAPKQVGW